jgi:hypothetical protein
MAGQVAYHLMAQSGMTRAPWAITTIVSCLPALVLGMGTALAHMLRADAETTDATDSGTRPPATLRSRSWSPADQDRPARRRPKTDQDRSRSGSSTAGETPGSQRGGDATRPGFHADRAQADQVRDIAPQAYRGREARIAAGVAQRRSPGLKRGAERTGTRDQQRASRSSAATCSGWLMRPAYSMAVVRWLRRSAVRVLPDSRRPVALCDHEEVPRGTAARWKRRYAVRLTVPRRGGWRAWGAVRADCERALADPADPAIAPAEIASELRRGAAMSG